ncbi:MAG: VanZ family protein [Mastigocoleus sp.]
MINFTFFIISTLAILIATLYPFKFAIPENFSLFHLVNNFNNATFFKDQVNNVLLFLPFGFSISNFLKQSKIKFAYQILIVVIASCFLSLTVEIIQIFVPSRAPTPSDIYNNTFGGFLGLLCVYIFASRSFKYTLKRVENSRASNSIYKISLFFIAYLCLIILISIPWQNAVSLSDWDNRFSLILGNEFNGGRPWEGSMKNLAILDKSYSKLEVQNIFSYQNKNSENTYLEPLDKNTSLLVFYDLSNSLNSQSYPDLAQQQPDLIWTKDSLNPAHFQQKRTTFNNENWLQSTSPISNLTERIRETSEFTLISTIQSNNITQTGPARIISLSADAHRRNFTLAQEKDNLVFRLRTPITGANGSDIKLNIPKVFTDQREHHIIITYSKAALEVYIDDIQNYHILNLLDLIPKEQIFFYYGITFIPMGLCLIFVISLAKKKDRFYRYLLPTGILLPSLILESILVINNGKTISWKTLFIGILFTTGTMLILKMRWSKTHLRRSRENFDTGI